MPPGVEWKTCQNKRLGYILGNAISINGGGITPNKNIWSGYYKEKARAPVGTILGRNKNLAIHGSNLQQGGVQMKKITLAVLTGILLLASTYSYAALVAPPGCKVITVCNGRGCASKSQHIYCPPAPKTPTPPPTPQKPSCDTIPDEAQADAAAKAGTCISD